MGGITFNVVEKSEKNNSICHVFYEDDGERKNVAFINALKVRIDVPPEINVDAYQRGIYEKSFKAGSTEIEIYHKDNILKFTIYSGNYLQIDLNKIPKDDFSI